MNHTISISISIATRFTLLASVTIKIYITLTWCMHHDFIKRVTCSNATLTTATPLINVCAFGVSWATDFNGIVLTIPFAGW
jgi:hypothetical protein